jgi:uncharacterized membrane protein
MYRLAALFSVLFAACGDNRIAMPDPEPSADATPPPPPGLRLFDYPIAVGVTPDGRTALFEDLGGGTGTTASIHLVDTITGEVIESAALGDPSRVLATAISATGRISALHGEPVEAAVWSHGGGWVDLASPFAEGCGSDVGGAWDVSNDGTVVVGLVWETCAPQAFRWTDASGTGVFSLLDRLGDAPADLTRPPTNRATVVSADGAITAGFAEGPATDRLPARWNADGSGEVLVPLDGDAPGEVLSISADGSVLAGSWGYDGFTWTEADGLVVLPRLDGPLPSDPVFPNAMTADGRTVFGGVGSAFFTVPTAFVWTSADGIRPLTALTTAAGIELPEGLVLTNVLGASADGTVLVGVAMDADGATHSFVLRLPTP